MQENCLGIKSPEKTKNSIENADRTMISLPIKELYNHEEFVSYHTGMAHTGQRIQHAFMGEVVWFTLYYMVYMNTHLW